MVAPWLIYAGLSVGAALVRSMLEDDAPASTGFPSAGLEGRYTCDDDGLALTVSGWKPGTHGALVLHARGQGGSFLRAAHPIAADDDGDFCVGRRITGDSCTIYVPYGIVMGTSGDKLTVSARIIASPPGGGAAQVVSEDMLTVEYPTRSFSIIRFCRPLVQLLKAVALADGGLAPAEVTFIRAFMTREFSLDHQELDSLRLALKEPVPPDIDGTAQSYRVRFPDVDLAGLAKLLSDLAHADTRVNLAEGRLVMRILAACGMSEPELAACASGFGLPDQRRIDECLRLLGLTELPSAEDLKAAWRKAVRDLHPDRYASTELPASIQAMLLERTAAANSAYETLCTLVRRVQL